jgi:hypothetical protein
LAILDTQRIDRIELAANKGGCGAQGLAEGTEEALARPKRVDETRVCRNDELVVSRSDLVDNDLAVGGGGARVLAKISLGQGRMFMELGKAEFLTGFVHSKKSLAWGTPRRCKPGTLVSRALERCSVGEPIEVLYSRVRTSTLASFTGLGARFRRRAVRS